MSRYQRHPLNPGTAGHKDHPANHAAELLGSVGSDCSLPLRSTSFGVVGIELVISEHENGTRCYTEVFKGIVGINRLGPQSFAS
jgi:hypothetical protein